MVRQPAVLDIDKLDDEKCLDLFYREFFPFGRIHEWLCHNNGQGYFSRREFSLTLDGGVYFRYQSYENEAEMTDKVRKQCPVKIDIGAVYSVRPSDRKSVSSTLFRPMERELVFDVDLTDYDQVRTCCQNKSICPKCWRLVSMAVKVIDNIMRTDFGFENMVWVFSGRRGVHCWICDDRARRLDNNARKAIVSYMDLVRGGAEQSKKVVLSGDQLHPCIRRSLEILSPDFYNTILAEQDIVGSEDKLKQLVSMVSVNREHVLQVARKLEDPRERWKAVFSEIKPSRQHRHAEEEMLLQFCYPRLDGNVTVQMGHLLKSPFCIHPDTGMVCVPFRATEVDSFDVLQVPTLRGLLKERYGGASTQTLDPYLDVFDEVVSECRTARARQRQLMRHQEDMKMEF